MPSTAYRNAIRLARRHAPRAKPGSAKRSPPLPAAWSRRTRRLPSSGRSQLEPQHPKSQFFLASALAQEGRLAEAVDRLEGHARQRCRPDSPWLAWSSRRLPRPNGQARGRRQRRPARPVRCRRDGGGVRDVARGPQRDDRDDGRPARREAEGKSARSRKAGSASCVPTRCWAGPTRRATRWQRGVAALGEKTEQAAQLQAFAASLGLARAE